MYKFFIKKSFKKKYQNSTNFKKDFLKSYKDYRNLILSRLKNERYNNYKSMKLDNTFNFLKKLDTEKTSFKKDKQIKIFCKKFEVNLCLKKKYNNKFIKQTNQNTNVNSYIILGKLMIKSKSLNDIQKLNCVLKINDFLCLNFNQIDNEYYENFKQIIFYELKKVRKIYYAK